MGPVDRGQRTEAGDLGRRPGAYQGRGRRPQADSLGADKGQRRRPQADGPGAWQTVGGRGECRAAQECGDEGLIPLETKGKVGI